MGQTERFVLADCSINVKQVNRAFITVESSRYTRDKPRIGKEDECAK